MYICIIITYIFTVANAAIQGYLIILPIPSRLFDMFYTHTKLGLFTDATCYLCDHTKTRFVVSTDMIGVFYHYLCFGHAKDLVLMM